MKISCLAMLVAAVAMTTQVDAAVRFVAVSSVGGATYSVSGWADGNKGRVDVTQSSGLAIKTGDVLLTRDGSQTIDRLEPVKGTYVRWDPTSLCRFVGGFGGGFGGAPHLGKAAPANPPQPTVEVLVDEEAGFFAGYPSRHVRFRITYASPAGYRHRRSGSEQPGASSESPEDRAENPVVRDEELWLAPDLKDAGLGVWLRTGATPTGAAALDALIAPLLPPMAGHPLKRVLSVTTSSMGRETESRATTEVTEIEVKEAPDGIFALPQGATEMRLKAPPKGGDGEGSEALQKALEPKQQAPATGPKPTASPKP